MAITPLLLVCSSLAQAADPIPLNQAYFVPVPEDQVFATLDAVNDGSDSPTISNREDTNILFESVVSISSSLDDTVIVYDHWEDGYETDLANPTQPTTQVWGDGDPYNGSAPCCAGDLIDAGSVIVLQSTVDSTNPAGDPLAYNGRDQFGASKPVAVTRVAWSTQPGTLLAGAIEVLPVERWGTEYEAPIGVDLATDEIFELVDASYMAAEDGTELQLVDPLGNPVGAPIPLNKGESVLIPNVATGSSAVSNKPVQLHALTGDIGATCESRWALALDRGRWGTEYYLPVSTRNIVGSAEDPTDVFLYNPHGSTLTVEWETTFGPEADVLIGTDSVARVRMPNGTGARFFATDDFYAIAAIDANGPNTNAEAGDGFNNRDFDWALALVPTTELSTQALVGFAPGIDPTSCTGTGPYDCGTTEEGSPVWVMSANQSASTTVYVDFDGDPNTGLLTDTAGNGYDAAVSLAPFERAKVFDPNDNDNTGTLLYTLDGSLIAAAWGRTPTARIQGARSSMRAPSSRACRC
jgi:hypothetical protein